MVPTLLFVMSAGCNNDPVPMPVSKGGASGSTTPSQSGQGGASGGAIISIPASLGGAGGSSKSIGGTVAPPSTGGNCGLIAKKADRVPADVLLVQDASGSMTSSIESDCDCADPFGGWLGGDCGTGTCVDRWSTLKTAVAAAVSANNGIQWGLELFADPNEGDCAVASKPQVPIGPNSAQAIQQELQYVRPASNTPTAAAITAATLYLKSLTDSNKKAILLSTDGEPNCGGGSRRSGGSSTSDLPNTLKAIQAAADAGFPVYVVGIGPSVGNLDSMAQAGGTSKFYPATSPQQLNDALAQISKVVASCSFASDTPPPDPNLVYVYVDKQLVQKDPTNGWGFGSNNTTVVLHGSVCDAVMAGSSKLVEIVFGCPNVPPPDIIY